MLTPRLPWVRTWACSLGHAPDRMELTPSANKALSFCANVDMELCLGSEKRSPACCKYLFPFSFAWSICTGSRELMEDQVRGGGNSGFSLPPTPPKELRLGNACSRDGAALLSSWYLWARKRTRWEDGREQTPLPFLQFPDGCDSYASFTELSSVRWPISPNLRPTDLPAHRLSQSSTKLREYSPVTGDEQRRKPDF